MPMYAPAFNQTSARANKKGFAPVNTATVLDAVAALELSTWQYRHNGGATHMGPMAEEFHAAFGLGADDEHIATVDADGVAFAAIQGLVERLDTENEALRAESEQLREQIRAVESRLAALETGSSSAVPADD
jgi:hypothetical protein